MKIGNLVKPILACGGYGSSGSFCKTAVILDMTLSNRQTQVAEHDYADVEVHEYSLLCACGTFEEYEDHLELIHEDR